MKRLRIAGAAVAASAVGICLGVFVLGGQRQAPPAQPTTLECRVEKLSTISETGWQVPFTGINRAGPDVGRIIYADCFREDGKQMFVVTYDPNNNWKAPEGFDTIKEGQVYAFPVNRGGYQPNTVTGNPRLVKEAR